MCTICDSRKKLLSVVDQLTSSGQPDIALKFTAFSEIVSNRTYHQDSSEDKKIKLQMFTLATSFAEGYMPISREDFLGRINFFVLPDDESADIRQSMKSSMIELFDMYGSRLPWALYGGYMFMVTRPNVHVAERLPDLRQLLPEGLPWECIDAVWHGFPPSTALYLHVLSVINKHTGTVPLHGCGCNHYLPPIISPDRALMNITYPAPQDIIAETEVPISHCLTAIETLVLETLQQFGSTTKSLAHQVATTPDLVVV